MTIPTRMVGLLTAACVVTFGVLLGLVTTRWSPLLTGDRAADDAAHVDVLAAPWLLAAARVATTIGSALVVDLVAVVVVVALLIIGYWRGAVLVVVALVGELACESAVKVLLGRPRPSLLNPVAHASGYSFPSGHAAGSAAVYGALVLLALLRVGKWARAFLLTAGALLVAAVAASRVLLGLHYPSDVAAGVVLGLAWVGGTALLVCLPQTRP